MRVVIPSVNYADILAESLPAWCRMAGVDAMTVVTAPRDSETRAVARANGVRCIVTDAWTRDEAVLNKALALDEAFGFVGSAVSPPADGDVCLSVDADSYPVGRLPDSASIAPRTLYGCWRHECLTPADMDAFLAGHKRLDAFPVMKNAGGKPIGYFQLFRWWPGLRFGSFPTAAKYDIRFREQFGDRWVMLDASCRVVHLGPGNVKANWRGRVVPSWRVA